MSVGLLHSVHYQTKTSKNSLEGAKFGELALTPDLLTEF